jgi:hypothetical protein
MIYPDGFTTRRVVVLNKRHLNFMAFSPVVFTVATNILQVR